MEKDLDPSLQKHSTALEKAFDKIMTPFEEFIHHETTSGILLMVCAVIAIVIANSTLYADYLNVLHTSFSISLGPWVLDKSVHHWVNDGLMALFFFVVGLEIKREVLVGELSDIRQASLPIVAAVGGMVVPAALYYSINAGGEGVAGWGIPMATDIAFAVGCLILLGSRIPKALLTFLVALAIVDDLGAVVVIAIFYTDQIHTNALLLSALFFGILIAFNLLGIRKPLPYFIIGLCLWVAMLKSGVHATLAGGLTALTIPATTKYDPIQFGQVMRTLLDKFDRSHIPGKCLMTNVKQRSILQTFENGIHMGESPLQRLEHNMHAPVAFLIIPIFALANAGVPIEFSGMGDVLADPITIGIITGLVLGKFIGIAGFSWIAIKAGFGSLPKGVSFSQICGVSVLAGIGFTMSIFIGELAFTGQPENLLMAKTGILLASLMAGIIGVTWLLMCSKPGEDSQQQ
ncbi:MAG TPA: Na+/H+ antiporter NhaA [Candidatus Tenderia sp.]|nr:Na+/H+ antiporter NhaA [Candidatus Tenderia sp.]